MRLFKFIEIIVNKLVMGMKTIIQKRKYIDSNSNDSWSKIMITVKR